MFKKITVLAMAVGAVAALALPASASANWQHNHQALQQGVTLGLTGNVRFQGALGGIECLVTSRATFNPGTTGVAETFVPDPAGQPQPATETNRCKGLGGLAFCQIHNLTPQAPNWTIHTQSSQTPQGDPKVTHTNAAVVTTQTIHSQATGGFCPVNTISLHGGNVGVIPEPTDSTTIDSVQLHGALQATLTTTNAVLDNEQVFVSGTLQIEDPNQRNTYGF
jgi:hypothetical protein